MHYTGNQKACRDNLHEALTLRKFKFIVTGYSD